MTQGSPIQPISSRLPPTQQAYLEELLQDSSYRELLLQVWTLLAADRPRQWPRDRDTLDGILAEQMRLKAIEHQKLGALAALFLMGFDQEAVTREDI